MRASKDLDKQFADRLDIVKARNTIIHAFRMRMESQLETEKRDSFVSTGFLLLKYIEDALDQAKEAKQLDEVQQYLKKISSCLEALKIKHQDAAAEMHPNLDERHP